MSRKKEILKRIGGRNSTVVLEKHTETFEYFMELETTKEHVYFDEDTRKHVMSLGKHSANIEGEAVENRELGGLVYIIHNPREMKEGKPEHSQCGYHSFIDTKEGSVYDEIKMRIYFQDYTTLVPVYVKETEIEVDYE